MSFSLKEWQHLIKPRELLLYNCSEHIKCNDEWVPFPIGIGYTFINYDQDIATSQIGNHEKLVLCAISPTTDIRRRSHLSNNRYKYLETLSKNNIYNVQLNNNDYFKSLPNYKFVISPEGNGIDCHRHYEALMAGCIPIIEDHDGIREKYGNCPILFTKDYSEINEDYLNKKYEEILNMKWDFSRLFIQSYSEEVQNEIRKNGNYWGNRLTGKKWYN